MVICMDSEVFLDKFVLEQSPKTVLDATYIVASNKIRYGKKYSNQIETMFIPNERTIISMTDEKSIKSKSNSDYVKRYYSEMDDDIRNIAIIIKMSLMKNILVIILTTKREAKAYGHIKLFCEYVKETFGYEVQEYKSDMKLKDKNIDRYEIISRCDDIIKKDKKKEKNILMKTEKGQREYFSCMGKDKMKKILKKEGLYVKGMSEAEMIDVALTFLV